MRVNVRGTDRGRKRERKREREREGGDISTVSGHDSVALLTVAQLSHNLCIT